MITRDVLDKYEMTIGIECHVQLATESKLFSSANNDSRNQEPNSAINEVDYGLPGMLPVLNRRAVDLAVVAGKVLNAKIANISRFDRKHYFYPDLPKGYQITQMYHPIILEGYVNVPLDSGESVRVRIHHAHLEEDAGKLTHYPGYTLVDLNRAGTPLIEIVSEPDIHSAEAARAYATELYYLLTYAGVTRGDLYHGNMRFDVNISVAPKGSKQLGNRTEVKNLNSFKSVERAAEYEFKRQVEVLERGESVIQETRGWLDDKQATVSQRSKEDAQDYRYLPDVDIPPVTLTDEEINRIQADLPMLPPAYREIWSKMKLDNSVVNSLLAVQGYAVLVTEAQHTAGLSIAKRIAHWFSSAVSDEVVDVSETGIKADQLVELAQMVEASQLSSTAAKEVFNELLANGGSPRQIAESKNLLQVSDEAAIADIVDQVLAAPESQKSLDDIRAGKDKAIGYLVGQVMKQSKGKANPALAQKLIRERL